MARQQRAMEGRSRSKLNNRQVKMARERAAAQAADAKAKAKPSPTATPKPARAPWDVPGIISDAVGGRRARPKKAPARPASQPRSNRSKAAKPKARRTAR